MTSSLTPPRRFRWGQAITVAVAFCILCGLGTWQVQRLGWKTRLLTRIAALQAAPAEPLTVVLHRIADGGDLDYTRVQADCPSLEQTPTVRLYAIRDGVTGHRLITACPVQGSAYRSILVDRGFVADEQAGRVVAGTAPIAGSMVGVLRTGDRRGMLAAADHPGQGLWYSRDVQAMAVKLGAPAPAPIFLMLETPAPQGFGPTPSPLPADIPNNHLGYILTWFGLAAALLSVYIAKLLRDRRA